MVRKFKPMPKPIKEDKKTPKGHWSGGVFIQSIGGKKKAKKSSQKYRTSTGELVTQSQIESRLSKHYAEHPKPHTVVCECCGEKKAEHHDHTLSQRACKIHKITELIYDRRNWSFSCSDCHNTWERKKSPLAKKHLNYVYRMNFLKEVCPEEYRKRKYL